MKEFLLLGYFQQSSSKLKIIGDGSVKHHYLIEHSSNLESEFSGRE